MYIKINITIIYKSNSRCGMSIRLYNLTDVTETVLCEICRFKRVRTQGAARAF